jgi:two-component system nitrogen regulation response regulator NtrX
MKHTVLVVDDEQTVRESVRDLLDDEGYQVRLAQSGEEALTMLRDGTDGGYDAVLLDVWLPKMDGLQVLQTLKQEQPALPVIMISGHANVETAVKATKTGAYHFVEKPFSADILLVTVRNAIRESKLERENVQLRRDVRRARPDIVGSSPAFRRLQENIERAAASDAWVLIAGENGTGKESVATLIHEKSARRDGPFVEVNSAAIPEELIESELFGHEAGSFTGAAQRKIGKFDQAHRGSLFLDEIGDMSLKTQAKMLRVLQEQRFERVGGNKPISVNVRVIAATNKKLEAEIREGRFREDLYYRLAVLTLDVPPLRERKEDIPLLVNHFIELASSTYGYKSRRVNPAVLGIFDRYPWPGNIRELRNIVERMMIMTRGDQELTLADVPPAILNAVTLNGAGAKAARTEGALPADLTSLGGSYREAKENFERAYLTAQLTKHNWNISKTAEVIRLERSNLHKKIRQLNIQSE